MKKILLVVTLCVVLITACGPARTVTPAPPPATLTPVVIPLTGGLSAEQAALKTKWQPVIVPYAYLEGICTTTQETVRGHQSGEIDSGKLPGDIVGIREILVIANQALNGWDPAPQFAADKTRAAAQLSNLSLLVDQWASGSLTGGEMSVKIAAICAQVTQESREVVASARADGMAAETLRQVGDAFQKSLVAEDPVPGGANPAAVAGLTPGNPFPAGSSARAPDLQVQVFAVIRGDAAQQMILSANPANDPAPAGMEYVLARVRVKNLSTAVNPLAINPALFHLTGARAALYDAPAVVAPDPALDAELNANEEAEGWVPLLAAKGETSLILVIEDIFTNEPNKTRYLALDTGAALAVPADVSQMQPTSAGVDRDHPARLGETVVTQEWAVTVTGLLRGAAAWKLIRQADPEASPPPAGMEYVLALVKVRYLGPSTAAEKINKDYFSSTGSAQVNYASPSIAASDPALDARLFPGGEATGWVPLLAKQGESDLTLVFKPLFELYTTNQRFLSLEK